MRRERRLSGALICMRFRQSAFLKNELGIAAVEFAILAPLIVLILVAIIEIGSLISSRLNVNTAVALTSNSILLSVQDEYNEEYAEEIADQVRIQSGVDSVTVNFNEAFVVQSDDSGSSTTLGSSVDFCYCPTGAGGEITWGANVECDTTCSDQSTAGRFVQIETSFSPPLLFGRFLPRNFSSQINAVVRIPL